MSGDLAGKRLELLKEAVPAARRIAVMMHPDEPIVPIQVRDISATAARIGVELEIISLRHGHELEGAFERAVHGVRKDCCAWPAKRRAEPASERIHHAMATCGKNDGGAAL